MCIFKWNKVDVVLFLFIIYVNFLVHNLNYPYIYSYKEWLCFFSLVGVSDLGFWGPFGYLCGFWPSGSHLFSLKVESFCGGLCRRLIFELIVVAVILACLGFWFWMARLVLPCKGAGLARTGLLGLVSSAPVNTYFSFPQSWFCVCMCVLKKKKKNLESILIAALWLQTFFSFVHYITLFVLDLLFFHIGSVGMMRFCCQSFSFLLMFSL